MVKREQAEPDLLLPGNINPLHIGKLIEAELRSQERTITWFSRQLHCDRRNVYDIFNRTSIDTQLLTRISCILQRNFFQALADSINGTPPDYPKKHA